MNAEPESIEDLVARLVREQLEQGRLEWLIKAQRAVEASFTLSVTPRLNFDVGPKRVDGALGGEGTLGGEVTVVPLIEAEATVIPAEVVNAIRSASPELADEIQARSPQDATQVINLYIALINLLAALLALYVAQHPAAPVNPQQIIQFFDHSQHITNQTTVVNPPPPH